MLAPILLLLSFQPTDATRVKDIAFVEGVRDNQLVGYGLVVGLNGTGDKTGTIFTIRSLKNLLSHMGVSTFADSVKVKNVAAVMLTANLPPFGRAGTRMDVMVSSLGDAASLQGGSLIRTSLKGPDGAIYAVAQGTVIVGGFAVGSESGSSVQKNHPTVGRIINGAIIEREVPFEFNDQKDIHISLHEPDFTTVTRLQEVINRHFGDEIAEALDPGTLRVQVPSRYESNVVALVEINANMYHDSGLLAQGCAWMVPSPRLPAYQTGWQEANLLMTSDGIIGPTFPFVLSRICT